jgi:hypothetical protein
MGKSVYHPVIHRGYREVDAVRVTVKCGFDLDVSKVTLLDAETTCNRCLLTIANETAGTPWQPGLA